MLFKTVLKLRMNEKGYSVRDLSEITGIASATIRSHLAGCVPSLEKRALYAKSLDIDLNDVIFDEGNENISPLECAKRMGKSVRYVKKGIINGTLPFGSYVRYDDGTLDFSIPKKAVSDYMHQIDRMEMFMRFIDERLQERK